MLFLVFLRKKTTNRQRTKTQIKLSIAIDEIVFVGRLQEKMGLAAFRCSFLESVYVLRRLQLSDITLNHVLMQIYPSLLSLLFNFNP